MTRVKRNYDYDSDCCCSCCSCCGCLITFPCKLCKYIVRFFLFISCCFCRKKERVYNEKKQNIQETIDKNINKDKLTILYS